MLDLDETFSKASYGYYEYTDTISSSMDDLSVKLLMDIMSNLTTSPAPSRISPSSKTPGRDLEDRWSLHEIPDVGFIVVTLSVIPTNQIKMPVSKLE